MAESWRAGGFHCTHQGLLSQTQDTKWDESFRCQLTSFYLTVPPRQAMQPPCPLSAAPCEWGHVLASCFPSYHCRPHTSYLARATLAHAGRPAAHHCRLDLRKTLIHAACHSIALPAQRSLQCPQPRIQIKIVPWHSSRASIHFPVPFLTPLLNQPPLRPNHQLTEEGSITCGQPLCA